jgi:hypothetical protein
MCTRPSALIRATWRLKAKVTSAAPPGSSVMFSGRCPAAMSRCDTNRTAGAGGAGDADAGAAAVTARTAATATARGPDRLPVMITGM